MSQYYYQKQRQEDLDSLQAMFESPWTRKLLGAVLEHHGGRVDEAVTSLLHMNGSSGNPEQQVEKLLQSEDRERKLPAVVRPHPSTTTSIPKSMLKNPPPPRRVQVPVPIRGSDRPTLITIEKSTRRRIGIPFKLPDEFLRIPKDWNVGCQKAPLFAPNHLDHLVDMTPLEPFHGPRVSVEKNCGTPEPSTSNCICTSFNLPTTLKNNDDKSREASREGKTSSARIPGHQLQIPYLKNIPKLQIPKIGQADAQSGSMRWSLPNLKRSSENDGVSQSSRLVQEEAAASQDPSHEGWTLSNVGANFKTPMQKQSKSKSDSQTVLPIEQNTPARWSLPQISTTLRDPRECPRKPIHPSHSALDPCRLDLSDSYAPINSIEYRGVTVLQLRALMQDVYYCCTQERWKNSESNQILSPKEVAMYDLIKHYIIPKTEEHTCSFVEGAFGKHRQRNRPEQQSVWFVSHAWNDSLAHLCECVEQHAFDRDMDTESTMYWICAFAMNQHSISDGLDSNGHENSLQNPWTTKNLINATCGTLAVVDKNAAFFSRAWCLWEVFLALQQRNEDAKNDRYIFDVYTTGSDNKAVGLTDGPVECDKYHMPPKNTSPSKSSMPKNTMDAAQFIKKQPTNPLEWSEHWVLRQSRFPVELCFGSLDVHIESAHASLKRDVNNILKCIVQHDRNDIHGLTTHDAEALTEHPAYTRLNMLIRGTFAGMLYRHALEGNDCKRDDISKSRTIKKIRQVLAAAPLQKLKVIFAGCQAFRGAEATYFLNSLPMSLRSLELDYSFLEFESSKEFSVGLRQLSANLQSLKINCAFCSNLSDLDHLWEELGELTNLRHLCLIIHPNRHLASIDGLSEAIRRMPELLSLELEFDCCGQYSKLVAMAKGGATLNSFMSIIHKPSDSSDRFQTTNSISKCFDKVPRLANLDFHGSYIADSSILTLVRTLTMKIHEAKLISLRLRFLGKVGKKLKAVRNMDDLLQSLHLIDQEATHGIKLF